MICPYCRKTVRNVPGESFPLRMGQPDGLRVFMIWHDKPGQRCADEDPLHQKLSDAISAYPAEHVAVQGDELNEYDEAMIEAYGAVRKRAGSYGIREMMETIKVVRQPKNPRLTARKRNVKSWGIGVPR